MIKRTLRGFNKLKKKYYTPEVKERLKKVGEGLRAMEKGSNSLVDNNDDPYGTAGMFSNQNTFKKKKKKNNYSFGDINNFPY